MNITTTDSRKFLSPSFRLGGIFDIILTLGLVCTWVGYLGPWHWFLALFDHFRIQGAIACLVALIVLGLRKRWGLVAFAALSLSANLWPLWQTSGPLASNVQADGSPGIKLISFNVLTSNTRYADTVAYLQAADADVILLMEVNSDWEKALTPLRQTHPHGTAEAQEDNFGIALYSRLPLTDYKVTPFVPEGMPSITAILKQGDRSIRLVGTHPLPPRGKDELAVQLAQLEAIAQHISATPEIPAVVLGDFNATPWSQAISLLREKSTLDFRTPKAVWRPTWQARNPFALPIDQALCTPQLFFETREIGPALGSDHRAQELLLKWARVDP